MRTGLKSLLVAATLSAALWGFACDDQETEQADTQSELPPPNPFEGAALVRVVNLAPSIDGLEATLERPVLEGVAEESRSITEAPLACTAFTPELFFAPVDGATLSLESAGTVLYEEEVTLTGDQATLVAAVEVAGAAGIELYPTWSFPVDGTLDGKTRVGVLHGDATLGRIDLTLSNPDDEVSWDGLSFGTDHLLEPAELSPGLYEVSATVEDDERALIAPPQLELQADTLLSILIAPPQVEGAGSRLVFVVDGPERFSIHAEPTPTPAPIID